MSDYVRFEKEKLEKVDSGRFQFGVKKDEIRSKVKNAFEDVKGFVTENRELIIAVVPAIAAVAGCVSSGVSKLAKSIDNNRIYKLEASRIYDHASGMYITLNHPMTNREIIEFNSLKESGLTTTQAVIRMGLIK